MPPVSVTYWMNSLQRLNTDKQFFVSLNPTTEPDPRLVVDEFSYDHPVFGNTSVLAQNTIQQIQGTQHTWYCGAWLGYGFHEDGLKSGITVAKQLGARVPWEQADDVQPAIAQSYAA
jgi:predicted NAD/FAD-binding protein